MSTINDGGPAFPVAEYDHQTFAPKTVDETRRLLSGMSLRDYFAAKAMPALLLRSNEIGGRSAGEKLKDSIARMSYDMADAMLKARG